MTSPGWKHNKPKQRDPGLALVERCGLHWWYHELLLVSRSSAEEAVLLADPFATPPWTVHSFPVWFQLCLSCFWHMLPSCACLDWNCVEVCVYVLLCFLWGFSAFPQGVRDTWNWPLSATDRADLFSLCPKWNHWQLSIPAGLCRKGCLVKSCEILQVKVSRCQNPFYLFG